MVWYGTWYGTGTIHTVSRARWVYSETMSTGEEAKLAVKDEEIEIVTEFLLRLDLTTDSAQPNRPRNPEGMTAERYHFVTQRLLLQQTGNLFASVDDAFFHEWSEFKREDFVSLLRDAEKHKQVVSDLTLKEIYNKTREAAKSKQNAVSHSKSLMRAGGSIPARLCKQVDLVAEAAHLCPKTGTDCKTDTWIYIAAAVLGLDNEDSSELLKALRGCYPPETEETQGRDPATIENTGLNRSPFNLMHMMEQKYVFDATSCVLAIPILDLNEIKRWNGSSYRVIVLCDDDKFQRVSHQEIAQSVGITMTNVVAATTDDTEKAISLLSHVVKFSAYALENMPAPPSTNGAALWQLYRKKLVAARSLYCTMTGRMRPDELQNKVVLPTAKVLSRKIIPVVDLGVLNQGIEKVVFPDPLLLAAKSSVNWTRKFAFQMIAEAEPTDEFESQLREYDTILGKTVDVGSHDDGSRSFTS